MKKAYVKQGLLGACAVCGLALTLSLTLIRPAVAQGNGNGSQAVGVMVEPILLTDDVESYEVMTYAWGRSRQPAPVETTIEITFTAMGPAGPYEVVSKQKHRRTTIMNGKIDRWSLKERDHGWDGYLNGEFAVRLNGLPPGEPVIGTLVRVYTIWEDPGQGAVYGGSSQAIDSNGKTSVFGKSHELTGHVILMK